MNINNTLTVKEVNDLFGKELTLWNTLTKENQQKVRHWKINHETEYREFKTAMMHAVYGDYKMYEHIFKLFAECIPTTVKAEIAKLFNGGEYTFVPTNDIGDDIKNIIDHDGYFKIPVNCFKDDNSNMEMELVEEQPDDDGAHLYIRATDTMDFWYSLPWDAICIIRSYTKGMREEQRALAVRVIYMKIMMSLPDIIDSINTLAEKNTVVYNVLYFVIFDHGLLTSFRVVSYSLTKQNNIGNFKAVVDHAITIMTKTSISKGYDTKAEWKASVKVSQKETTNDNHLAFINDIVDKTSGTAGRPKTATNILRLDEILVGDLPSLLRSIKEYRHSNDKPIDLSYLFLALREAGCLNTEFYAVFHRAMEDFEGKKYNIRYPQQMCINYPLDEEILQKRGTRQQKRKKPLIDYWQKRFITAKLVA